MFVSFPKDALIVSPQGPTFFRFCTDQFPDGSTGRKLYRYFRERGLNNVIVHPEPLVLHGFALALKMMDMVQFLAAALEQGVLALDEIEAWQRELKAADAEGRFMFAGMIDLLRPSVRYPPLLNRKGDRYQIEVVKGEF